MTRKRIEFRETATKSASPPVRGATPDNVPAAKDHVGWALYWSEECTNAMARYVEHGNALDLEHVHRSGRFLWWHICRAKKYYYWDPFKREGSI